MPDIDTTKVRELLDQRDAIDKELAGIFAGDKERKPLKCSLCQKEGHTARTCPSKTSQ